MRTVPGCEPYWTGRTTMAGGDGSGRRWRSTTPQAGGVADGPEARDQPPVLVAGLAGLLIHGPQGEAARALLHEAQQHHPEDFWINFQLGYLLQDQRPQEAVGFFRAAVASRPDSSQAHIMLGRALRDAGDTDGAATRLPQGHQAESRPGRRPRPGQGPGAEGQAGGGPHRSGRRPSQATRRITTPGTATPSSAHSSAEDDAYRRARRALLERFGDSHRPLGHRRAR